MNDAVIKLTVAPTKCRCKLKRQHIYLIGSLVAVASFETTQLFGALGRLIDLLVRKLEGWQPDEKVQFSEDLLALAKEFVGATSQERSSHLSEKFQNESTHD
jgi:hypothetical protein